MIDGDSAGSQSIDLAFSRQATYNYELLNVCSIYGSGGDYP